MRLSGPPAARRIAVVDGYCEPVDAAVGEARTNGSAAQADAPAQVVLLAEMRSATETRLVGDWARAEHPGAPILGPDDPQLGTRLTAGGDPEVIPVRVTWVPRERNGDRRALINRPIIPQAQRVEPIVTGDGVDDGNPAGVGEASHGQHDRQRAPGSIGNSSFAARVMKGMRMGGRMGQDRVKVKGLKVVKVFADKNYILVSGSVPGHNGSIVLIQK